MLLNFHFPAFVHYLSVNCLPSSTFLPGPYIHAGNVDFTAFKATFLFLGCEMLMAQGSRKNNNSMSRFVEAEINNEANKKIQSATSTTTSTGQETTSTRNNNNQQENNLNPVGKPASHASKSNKSTHSAPSLHISSTRDDIVTALTSRESTEWTTPLYLPISTSIAAMPIAAPVTTLSPSKSRVSLNELLEKKTREQDEVPAKRQPRLSLGTTYHHVYTIC